jgi:hypothetical protein
VVVESSSPENEMLCNEMRRRMKIKYLINGKISNPAIK